MAQNSCSNVVCGANACVFDDDLSYGCDFERIENKNYKVKIIDKEMGEREIAKMKNIDEKMNKDNNNNQY